MFQIYLQHCKFNYSLMIPVSVDEMIAEVDLDGDGRIDFEGN